MASLTLTQRKLPRPRNFRRHHEKTSRKQRPRQHQRQQQQQRQKQQTDPQPLRHRSSARRATSSIPLPMASGSPRSLTITNTGLRSLLPRRRLTLPRVLLPSPRMQPLSLCLRRRARRRHRRFWPLPHQFQRQSAPCPSTRGVPLTRRRPSPARSPMPRRYRAKNRSRSRPRTWTSMRLLSMYRGPSSRWSVHWERRSRSSAPSHRQTPWVLPLLH